MPSKKQRSKKKRSSRAPGGQAPTVASLYSLLERQLKARKEEDFVRSLAACRPHVSGLVFPANHTEPTLDGRTTLLFAACCNKLPRAVEALCECEDLDPNMGHDSFTPFFISCEIGALKCVQRLVLMPGINLNAPAFDGTTPFAKACRQNHLLVVEFLLSVPSIDVNAACQLGGTGFTSAVENGYLAVAKLLLADKRIETMGLSNHQGRNPMDLACYSGSKKMVQLLAEHGLEPPTQPQYSLEAGQYLDDRGRMSKARAKAAKHVQTGGCSVCGSLGKTNSCSRCRSVIYCGAACQRADWPTHKKACKKLAAAAALATKAEAREEDGDILSE